MARIAFITLGCKTNQFETQAMELFAREAGHDVLPPEEKADIYVVNTCAVTSNAGKKSRQEMRAARKRNPDAVIAVCGCYSLLAAEELLQSGDADLVGGNRDHRAFLEACLSYRDGSRGFLPTDEKAPFERLPAGHPAGRTRSLLKIEDGCSNFCAYCIIPYLRGRVRSEDPAFLKSEVRRLVRDGAREIVLTGIEIASYGEDLPGRPTLGELLERLAPAAGEARLRLGSLEPRIVTEDFCRRLAGFSSLCPHFHLSLQSGSDAVLKRMGRKYDTALFRRSVELLRASFPDAAITTDIITGFPGESEEEFGETLAFCREIRFDRVHAFPYSMREGTRAARMPGQVPRRIKEERVGILSSLASEIAEEKLRESIGKEVTVLFETEEGGISTGYTANYHLFSAEKTGLSGRLLKAVVRDARDGVLRGDLLSPAEEH